MPEDKGITGAVIIAESHLGSHIPIKITFIDVFSCKPFDTDVATQYCIELFSSQAPDVHLTMRENSLVPH